MRKELQYVRLFRRAAASAALSVLVACGQTTPPAEKQEPADNRSAGTQDSRPLGTADSPGKQGNVLDPETIQAVYAALDAPPNAGAVRTGQGAESASDPAGIRRRTDRSIQDVSGGLQPGITSLNAAAAVEQLDTAEAAEAQAHSLGQSSDTRKQTASVVSDEQDFEAVAQRESIESDALRRQAQQATRVDYLPEELPEKQGSSSVAQYAFTTDNNVGNKIYRRFGTFFTKRSLAKRCAEYGNDYAAQQAFLDAGGPQNDKLHLDIDGDGFACGWTPDIYRSMIR